METDKKDDGEVKEFTDTVQVVPTNDEELVESEEEIETPDLSSEEKKEPEDEEPSKEKEKEEDSEVAEEQPKVEPKPVEGETPRERALRLEMTRIKGQLRNQRRDELFVKQPNNTKNDLDEIDGYDIDELKRFEEVATKLGFARRDEIIHQTTQDKLNDEFDSFIEKHPEYSPENDKDGVLWNQLKSEFELYIPPKDPRTLRKILNKVHNEIYGVQPAKNLSKINASQEKIKVASHTGASANKESKETIKPNLSLRKDAMKGFSEDELKEILG